MMMGLCPLLLVFMLGLGLTLVTLAQNDEGTSKLVMALQPFHGETRYERFQRQHVDSTETGGTDLYCNRMMQTREMTSPVCKKFNTFIHEDIGTINNICSTPNIQCKNREMNCHAGVVRVTDCRHIKSSGAPYCLDRVIMGGDQPPICNYQGKASTRRVVIACEGNPLVPVHFDG